MTLTRFLAKVMGLWIVLTALGMMFTRQATIETMNALFTNPPLMWVTGVFTMLIGLGVVLAHNRWSEGPVAALVTFYGWAALIKGLSLVWLPPATQTELYGALHFERFYPVYLIVALILGGYLIYGGFRKTADS